MGQKIRKSCRQHLWTLPMIAAQVPCSASRKPEEFGSAIEPCHVNVKWINFFPFIKVRWQTVKVGRGNCRTLSLSTQLSATRLHNRIRRRCFESVRHFIYFLASSVSTNHKKVPSFNFLPERKLRGAGLWTTVVVHFRILFQDDVKMALRFGHFQICQCIVASIVFNRCCAAGLWIGDLKNTSVT